MRNAVQRKPVLMVPFTFDGPAGRGGYRLVVALPNGAKTVSLRATATDVQGNSIEQTVLRAFSISD
jgi:transcription termination factor Rho